MERLFHRNRAFAFKIDFLSEGYFDGALLMLPIAKSTEALYLNKTLFDRFQTDVDVSPDALSTFEGVFDICHQYYDWSGGQSFI